MYGHTAGSKRKNRPLSPLHPLRGSEQPPRVIRKRGVAADYLYRSTRRPIRRTVWPSASPDSKDVQEACVRNARPGGNPGGADPRRARPIGAFRDLLVQRPRIGVRLHRGVPRRRHPHLYVVRFVVRAGPGGRFVVHPNTIGPDPPSILREHNVGAMTRSRKQRWRLFIHGELRLPTRYQQGFHRKRLSGSRSGLPGSDWRSTDHNITGSTGSIRAAGDEIRERIMCGRR